MGFQIIQAHFRQVFILFRLTLGRYSGFGLDKFHCSCMFKVLFNNMNSSLLLPSFRTPDVTLSFWCLILLKCFSLSCDVLLSLFLAFMNKNLFYIVCIYHFCFLFSYLGHVYAFWCIYYFLHFIICFVNI